MGHGAPRTLSADRREIEPIPTDLAERLEQALKKLDATNEAFSQSRADERHQQLSKAWAIACNQIVEDLRHVGNTIVAQHQVLCDCGQDGAGITTTPYIEESMERFPKLHIRLVGHKVQAESDGNILLEADDMAKVDYTWLEQAAIEWMIWAAQKG